MTELCPGCTVVDLVKVGGKLLFLADDGTHGREVWTTDGTVRGTVMVKDACPGRCAVTQGPLSMVAGAAFFFGFDRQVWRTDGTAAGTRPYTDLPANVQTFSSDLIFLGPTLFFSASTTEQGAELWVSNGRQGGTRMLADLVHGAPSSSPRNLVRLGERLLFVACDGESVEVWQSAGTGATRLTSSPEVVSGCREELVPQGLTASGNSVFFWDQAGGRNGSLQLWRSDGTPGGLLQLTSSLPVTLRIPLRLYALRGQVFFLIKAPQPNGQNRLEVWRSDGTAQGTGKAFDVPAVFLDVTSLHTVGDDLYIVGYSETGKEIWRSDGTGPGVRILAADLEMSEPFQFVRVGTTTFFSGTARSSYEAELWKTDGTAAGTLRVRYLHYGSFAHEPSYLTSWRGALYFFAAGSTYGPPALWRSDGSEAGTTVVREFPWEGPRSQDLLVFGDRLFFAAGDEAHGYEIWQSDGTAAGTTIVRDLFPGPSSSGLSGLRAAGDRLFFSASDGVHGFELWQSDGTPAGTRLVQDLAPGATSSAPQEWTVAGGALFFSANDGYTGRELWALPLAGGPACSPSSTRLCLNGGRFAVEASWTAQGRSATANAVSLTADTGYFWFFGPENVEVVVKVLDGRGVNDHHWVFYGALSNVEYALTVTDTQTGATVRYSNPAGQFASVGDVTGFGRLGAFSSKTFKKVASASPPALPALISERFDPAAATGVCQAGPTRLCLNGGRFAVEATWRAQGRTDAARAVPLTADTGYFWFFGADNVEVVLKVLDGRPINNKFWVFYGALSDVEYTLTVTDTQTGRVKTYANPQGRFASVGDTAAF